MSAEIKALHAQFKEGNIVPYLYETGNGFRVKHVCGKDYVIYFNDHNIALARNGCTCPSTPDDLEHAFGRSLPWAKGESSGGRGTSKNVRKAIVPPTVKPTRQDLMYRPQFSAIPIEPSAVYEYKNNKGEILSWFCRWNNPLTGEKELHHRYLVEGDHGPEFVWRGKGVDIDLSRHMLYGLEYWDPSRPTLFVEGEKTADAARKILPTWNVLTWAHGRDSYKHNDFSFLKGQAVVIWPDNDKAGMDMLEGFANVLSKYDITLRTTLDKINGQLPDKWDLADPNDAQIDINGQLANASLVKKTSEANEYIQELNLYMRRIKIGRRTLFVDLRPKPSKPNQLFYSLTEERSLYLDYPWKMVVPGVKTMQRVVDVWLEKISTPILQGVTFNPSTTEPIVRGQLNNFIGFPFSPVKPDRQTHKELAKAYKLLCDLIPNSEQRNWVFDYAADIFQNPSRKPTTFLTLIGGQGVGKSLLVQVLRHIIGDLLYCAKTNIDGSANPDKFNGMESGALLLWQDEIKITGKNALTVYDNLKSDITTSVKQVNRKGIDQTQEPSYERRIFTSNHDVPFHISYDDRRTTIIRLSSVHQNNRAKFELLGNIIEKKELAEGLMWFFVNRRIKSNINMGLATEGKVELVVNENPILEALYNMFNECEVPGWLSKLFIDADQEDIGTRPIKMGRTLIKDAMLQQFGKYALNKRVQDQLPYILYDEHHPLEKAQGQYNYVDERGMNRKKNNSYYMFTTWAKMRVYYDKIVGVQTWKPIPSPSPKTENSSENNIVNLPKKDIL